MKRALASLFLVACGNAELPPVYVTIEASPTATPAPETKPEAKPEAKERVSEPVQSVAPMAVEATPVAETEKQRLAREACEATEFDGKSVALWFEQMHTCAGAAVGKFLCEDVVLHQSMDNFMAIRKELAECQLVPENRKWIGRVWIPIWEK